jgi:hypothetical protein
MADLATLFIKVDSKGVVTASKDLNKLTGDSKKTEKATEGVTSSFSKLRAIVIALGIAYAALKMARYIKDATMLAARYETLGVVMRVVGNNAGFSGAQMEVFAKGLQKAGIAMVESRTTIVRMAQAQIDLTKSSDLARIAQDAAVIGNINSSESFERMILGIQRGMPRILTTIGLNVNFQKSYKALAASLGVNVKALTDLQKIQARTNAVIQEGTKIAGSYEAAMETAGKQVLSLKRHLDNLKVLFGAAFTPALAEIIFAITGNIKDLNKELEKNKEEWNDWGVGVAINILDVQIALEKLKQNTVLSDAADFWGDIFSDAADFWGFLISDAKEFWAGEAGSLKVNEELNMLLERRAKLIKSLTPEGKEEKRLAEEALETARMQAAAISKRESASLDALAKIAEAEKAMNESRIKAEEDYTDFWLLKAQERSEVQSRALEPLFDVDALIDDLAKQASYYEDLIGFEETYHQKSLDLIEAKRQAAIIATEDVAAADARAHAEQMELLKEKFENENKYVNSTIDNTGKMLDAAMSMYDKDSSEFKKLADLKKVVQVAELAMEAAKNIAIISGYFAKSTAAVGAATVINAANTTTAITGAASSVAAQGQVPIVGFALAAAMVGVMASILGIAGIAFGGGGGGSPTVPSLPASTVLGAEDGTGSESITKGWELLEDTYDMQFRELSGIHSEMKNLNDNITGLVAGIFRTGGLNTSFVQTGSRAGDFGRILGNIFGGNVTEDVVGAGISTGTASIGSLTAGGGVSSQQFTDIEKWISGNFFTSGHAENSTVLTALDSSVSGLLDKVFQNLSATLVELTTGLGADMQATLNHVFPGGEIDLTDLTGEEMSKALSEHFSALGDNAVDALFGSMLRQYQQLGEGLFETAARILVDKAVVLDALEITGQAFSGTIPQVIAFSEAIVEMSGGFETLHENAEIYFNKFFSDGEKQIRLQDQLTGSLSDLGLVLPDARDGYRALLESLDLTTDSGQRAFVSLLALSGAADDYYSHVEDLQEDLNKVLSDAASTARQAAQAYESVTDSLQAAIDQIRGITGTSGAGFKSLFETAITGDIEALSALPAAARTFLEIAKLSSVSAIDYKRAEGEVLTMLNEALLVSTALSVPQFHAGGIATGPESGYGATLHGTELVVSPNASFPATVKGGDSPPEQALLLKELTAEIKVGNFQIAKNTGKISDILTRFDYDGMPAERTTN